MKRTKKCGRCGRILPVEEFYDLRGVQNVSGRQCRNCLYERRMSELTEVLASELGVCRKLHSRYGSEWDKACNPSWVATLLFNEFERCIYCGQQFASRPDEHANTSVDHMDAMTLGGEDSIRNCVVVCRTCNTRKKNMRFDRWLEKIPKERRNFARRFYYRRHGYQPEDFVLRGETIISECLNVSVVAIAGRSQGFQWVLFDEDLLGEGCYDPYFIDPPNAIKDRKTLMYFRQLRNRILRSFSANLKGKLSL